MITNEVEIRIALQAVLISGLALDGYWGWALLVLLILMPWKPIFAVTGYLAQPVVDWRRQKARERRDKGIAQIERELDALMRSPGPVAPALAKASAPAGVPEDSLRASGLPHPIVPANCRATPLTTPGFPETAASLSAAKAVLPIIKDHVRTLPQGVFHNMSMEIEAVQLHGETADAFVRFQSPHVSELIIRQRYGLRRTGKQWTVESRQPAKDAGMACPGSSNGNLREWLT